jgi:hypothetical protein
VSGDRDNLPSAPRRRRKKHNEVTEDDLCAFLDVLDVCANPEVAAERVGLSMNAVQHHRLKDRRFRESYDELADALVGRLEAEAYVRALDRNDKASSKLLIFMLSSLKPEKYGTQVTVRSIDATAHQELARVQAHAIENPEGYEAMAEQLAQALEGEIIDEGEDDD